MAKQSFYSKFLKGLFQRTLLSLYMYPIMNNEETDYISTLIGPFYWDILAIVSKTYIFRLYRFPFPLLHS